MHSNKITYIYVAIDNFTKVANKIRMANDRVNRSINKGASSINTKLNPALRKLENTSAKTTVNISKSAENLNKMAKNTKVATTKVGLFGKLLGGLSSTSGALSRFSHKMDQFSDFFGMSAYYKFMNIALPMMMLGKLGMTYADSLQKSNIQMTSLFSNTKMFSKYYAKINTMAEKYRKISRFPKDQIMAAAAVSGKMTNNIKVAQETLPVIMRYAIATGNTKDLSQAAAQFFQGVRSGALPQLDIRLFGNSNDRLRQAIAFLNLHYTGIIAKDAATASGQLAIFFNKIRSVAGEIMVALAPAFSFYGKKLDVIMPKIEGFIKTHSKLIVNMGIASIAALVFLAALATIGAILGVIAMPITLLSKGFWAFVEAIKIVKYAVMGLVVVFRALSAVMLLSGIDFIIIGVVLLGVAIYEIIKHFKTLKKVFKEVFSYIKCMLKDISKDIMAFIHHFKTLEKILSSVKRFFNKDRGEGNLGQKYGKRYDWHAKWSTDLGQKYGEHYDWHAKWPGSDNINKAHLVSPHNENQVKVHINVHDNAGLIKSVHTESTSQINSSTDYMSNVLGRNLSFT